MGLILVAGYKPNEVPIFDYRFSGYRKFNGIRICYIDLFTRLRNKSIITNYLGSTPRQDK